jgi:toxin-antitoxin system PIN domain toxin
MFVVDTNVLLDAVNAASPVHEPCHRRLEEWRGQSLPWFLTWGIVYEFLRVATHPRVFSRPLSAVEAWRFMACLLDSPGSSVLTAGDRHRDILAGLVEELPDLRGNVLHDAHTAALMREHGIRQIFTRDTGFHRFRFLEVRDPLA